MSIRYTVWNLIYLCKKEKAMILCGMMTKKFMAFKKKQKYFLSRKNPGGDVCNLKTSELY